MGRSEERPFFRTGYCAGAVAAGAGRGRLTAAPCVPSLMATGAPLTAMGLPPFPSVHPLCSSSLSAAGGGCSRVGNDWSGFLCLGH